MNNDILIEDIEWIDDNGKRIGTAFKHKDGEIVLRLCPKCSHQNYAANGSVCSNCGFDAKDKL